MKSSSIRKDHSISLGSVLLAITRVEKKVDRLYLQKNLEKEYLTTQESCAYLGCTRSMIWKLAKAGTITKIKKDNGRTYYASHELKSYIEGPTIFSDEMNNQEG
jgi:excisionase family DNA binding protein